MAKKKPFKELSRAAIGIGGLAVVTGVTAGIVAQAPAGTPSLTGATATLAGFAPVAATVVGAKAVLGVLPKGKGVKIKGKRVI